MTQTVKVPLASNALYVSGTVNGVDRIWTREEGNLWSTTADRATDGVYRVALSIVYGDGKTAEDSITLYYGLVLVTDRTQNDVANGTKNGYYNSEDLNRVGSAMVYLRDRLNDNGYNINIEPETAWTVSDIPTQSDMVYYLGCLGTLKAVLPLPPGTPDAPETMENLTYTGANNIEQILLDVETMLNAIVAVFPKSGQSSVFAGNVFYFLDAYYGEQISKRIAQIRRFSSRGLPGRRLSARTVFLFFASRWLTKPQPQP